jgi:hypothetical protein
MAPGYVDALQREIEQRTLSEYGLNKRAVLFGTIDCADAARQVGDFVEQAFSSHIAQTLLIRVGSAFAAGLLLTDGRKIFVKIHPGEFSLDELNNHHRAQELLREQGLPIARLILGATLFGREKYASAHAFRDRGDRQRAYHSGTIAGAAQAFGRLIEAARQLPADIDLPDMLTEYPHPFWSPGPGMPPPRPFPPKERIEAVVAAVKDSAIAVLGRKVMGHGDWASRNMKFLDGEVSAIFDFEALVFGPEPVLTGQAAIQFVNEPQGVRDPAAATVEFIKAYETAVGRAFDGEDAVSLDIGVARAVSVYCRRLVRTRVMQDKDAVLAFKHFMTRFRAALERDYAPASWV